MPDAHAEAPTTTEEPELHSRLRFETFLADTGARFLLQPAADLPREIDRALTALVDVLEVDRCGLGLFSADPERRELVMAHSHSRPGIPDLRGTDLATLLPWWTDQLRRGNRMVFNLLSDELPPEAVAERRLARETGLRSHTVLPLVVGSDVLGALGVASFHRKMEWSPEFLKRLELLANGFAHALYRYRAEDRITAAEDLNRAILHALPSEVFVLDRDGRVLSLNEAARRASAVLHADPLVEGGNYLATFSAAEGANELGQALEGIRSVLDGRATSFSTTCALAGHGRGAPRIMHVVALEGHPGVVVTRWDVSELERTKAELQTSLREVEELRDRLEAENVLLHREVRHVHGFESIVGRSAALGRVLSQVEQVAPTDSPVLLLGETGTGKDLVARALHDRSRRRERPMVAVNCAALPASLIESELFGYERGAFTGALTRSVGRFEIADRGTIFLDEIGELPLEVQAKLLRVLQSGEFERLGSPRTLRANVRVIAATNRDLEREMREGRFRPDLYYRLSVFPVQMPALRDRPEDIPLLVWHFVSRKQVQLGRAIKRIPERLMRSFATYHWPGNVRELENVIERALILSEGNTLTADPVLFSSAGEDGRAHGGGTLEDVERAYVRAVLIECNWKVAGPGNAAERLGLNRSTLQFRMRKLGIERPSRENG